MMAATANLKFYQRGPVPGSRYDYPVAAGVRIFRHAIVGVTASLEAVPAGNADCVALVGLALDPADNRTGAKGSKRVIVGTGVFQMDDAFASVGAADIKSAVYASDDDTLSLTALEGELPLGTIDAIDEEGVWVRI
jgi:hypothetical protein